MSNVQFGLTCQLDAAAPTQVRELDGVFVPLTNWQQNKCPITAVMAEYHAQSQLAKRFHHCMRPLAGTPIFLE